MSLKVWPLSPNYSEDMQRRSLIIRPSYTFSGIHVAETSWNGELWTNYKITRFFNLINLKNWRQMGCFFFVLVTQKWNHTAASRHGCHPRGSHVLFLCDTSCVPSSSPDGYLSDNIQVWRMIRCHGTAGCLSHREHSRRYLLPFQCNFFDVLCNTKCSDLDNFFIRLKLEESPTELIHRDIYFSPATLWPRVPD